MKTRLVQHGVENVYFLKLGFFLNPALAIPLLCSRPSVRGDERISGREKIAFTR